MKWLLRVANNTVNQFHPNVYMGFLTSFPENVTLNWGKKDTLQQGIIRFSSTIYIRRKIKQGGTAQRGQ